MTPSGFMKPKLGFSIESLVGGGGQTSPALSDTGGPDSEEPLTEDSPRAASPLSLEPLFPRALLSLQEKVHMIQRPQPINGATHRVGPDPSGPAGLPGGVLQSKCLGGPFGNPLLPQSLGLSSFPPLQGLPLGPQLNPLMMGAVPGGLCGSFPREYPLYPWLLSRHGRVFPQGLPSPEQLAYLLQPFRKPKRIRTAFSPSQLLKLEQAFERNQYVVGAERKQLAINLCLSETQVKVWFQNRRTKEKRIQQDDEGEGGGERGRSNLRKMVEDEEDIEDLDEEEIEEDEEVMEAARKAEEDIRSRQSEGGLEKRKEMSKMAGKEEEPPAREGTEGEKYPQPLSAITSSISSIPSTPPFLPSPTSSLALPSSIPSTTSSTPSSTSSSLPCLSLDTVPLPKANGSASFHASFDPHISAISAHPPVSSLLTSDSTEPKLVK